jgi:flagellar basal-body rod protein FlgG
LDGNFGRVAVEGIADDAVGMLARLCNARVFRRGTVVAQQGFVNVSLFQAGAALNANSRWQEVIADNLASGEVPGYKRQQLSMAAVQAGLMPGGLSASRLPQMFVLPKGKASTNFSVGELRSTGVPTDLAIEGKGFFEVQMPGGTTGYTRNGAFQMNSKGQLATAEGYPVLGESGPIQLNPSDSTPISISATGEVSQGATRKGKLAVADFNKPELLTQVSASYFAAQDSSLQAKPTTAKVRQGYLEASNSSSVLEMASLMTAMRGFEANQHVIQIQDDRLGRTISDLGNPT